MQKLYLGADPSSYAGNEVMMGCIYGWEKEEGCYGLPTHMPGSKIVGPNEFEMDDSLWARCKAKKVG